MRIDPSNPYLNQTTSGGLNKAPGEARVSSTQSNPDVAVTGSAEDTVRLSATLSQVQLLKAQLSQVPEVRAARVAALQQQLQQGSYRPSTTEIASAMLADLSGASGT